MLCHIIHVFKRTVYQKSIMTYWHPIFLDHDDPARYMIHSNITTPPLDRVNAMFVADFLIVVCSM